MRLFRLTERHDAEVILEVACEERVLLKEICPSSLSGMDIFDNLIRTFQLLQNDLLVRMCDIVSSAHLRICGRDYRHQMGFVSMIQHGVPYPMLHARRRLGRLFKLNRSRPRPGRHEVEELANKY